ncbi:MAG TPA: HPF/RaiA family ribosome-associated protein [Gemmataceae bacterium]
MRAQPQITFLNMPHSEAAEALIRENVEKLNTFYDGILNCQVVVDVPHRRHQEGNQYEVRIVLSVPGNDIIISRTPDEQTANQDLRQAIRDAFDAAGRRLQDYVRRRRGQ